jgi:hypothetical protein
VFDLFNLVSVIVISVPVIISVPKRGGQIG